MRLLKTMLPLLVLLLWGTTAKAQYNPENPPEPGVNFTLSARSVPSDAGYNFYGPGTHSFGSNVDVRVSTTTGYRFLWWEDQDGTVISTETRFTYTMPAKNVTLIARFEYNPASPDEPSTPEFKDVSYINVEINPSDAGYLYMYSSNSGTYEVGTTQHFEIRPYNSYRFVNWTMNGTEVGTSQSLDLTIPQGDQTLVANFAYDPTNPGEPGKPVIPKKLTLQTNLAGAGYLSGEGSYEPGSSVTVSASTNTYFHFVNWTDENGDEISNTSRFTYTMPDRHVTLTANYTYYYDPTSPAEPGIPNPDGSVAENMVLWPRMGMYDDTHVQILCETPGATIHYTLDGTTPTAASPVYTAPVFVGSNLLVKAIAYKEGMEDSPVVSYQVTAYKTGIPIFTFENRLLKITSETPDAIIRFTTDFTNPNEESEIYTAPFLPEENCRIKAYASKEGLTDSPINIFIFRRADYTIPAPTFSINDEGKLVITPAVSGGKTYYTFDGTDPTAASELYTEPLLIDGNFRIRAYTIHPNYYDSEIGEYSLGGFQVETPTYVYADLALTLATATPGATLRYTLDGTIPSEESAVYSSPLRLNEDCIVVARGFKENYDPSETVSFTFVLAEHKAATPVLTYNPETLTITIACDTENAEMRYTIDGEAPTESNSIRYEGPITVTGNHTYTARAFRSDLFASEAASAVVDDLKVSTPTANFANKLLTLACSDAEARIVYTLDGDAPTATSTAYTAPIALTQDCTVRFMAVKDYYHDSDIASFDFKVAEYQVATPTVSHSIETKKVTMTCATEGASIRYTTDGSVPTATTGTLYESPININGNVNFTVRAFRSDLFDSEIATLVIEDLKVPTPTASFANKLLTLACSDAEARIVYTLDGNAPTAASTVYTAPIALTQDCTVRFMAIREYYLDSDIASFDFKVAEYQVAAPTVSHSTETMKATMSCATTGASIRYTTDGSVPTATTGTLYESPINISGNVTFTVKAFRDGFFDSEITVYTIDNLKLPTPTAAYGKHSVTLTCEDSTTDIRYTTDGTAPTAASTLYTAPIAMSADCTVRFIAVKAGYVSSDEGTFKFVLAEWQEALPTVTKDFEGRKLTISQKDSCSLIVTIDGKAQTLKSPATLDVTPGMSALTAVAVAQNEDRYDSPAMSDAIVFHKVPALSYNGHTLRVSLADGEPASGAAERLLFIDGKLVANGTYDLSKDIDNFCDVAAIVRSEGAFISDPFEMPIDFFNTGSIAGARNGHRLAEGFGTWGDKKESYTNLRLVGELNKEDMKTIATLDRLATLRIDAQLDEEDDYNEVFAGTRIETIFSPTFPKGMLKFMPRLTTLIWGKYGEKMPEGIISETGNPNLLLWVCEKKEEPKESEESEETEKSDAPDDAINVVEYSVDAMEYVTDPEDNQVEGHSLLVTLMAGYPFNAHKPVHVGNIELEKEFSLPTVIDECSGWETLTIPFDAESIKHQTAGPIISFAIWDDENKEGPKPFWLYRADGGDWEIASDIQAGVPYIISMPNNEEYVEAFNLAGKVKFYGSNVTLGTEKSAPAITDWKDGNKFIGTYMPVDEPDIYSLNVNAPGENGYAGSEFAPGNETLPFGAYVRAAGSPKAIPVFGESNGIRLPGITMSGLVVETPSPGIIRVSSSNACKVAIFTPDGATVRSFSLSAGESKTVEGLTRGLYICGGVKVMVK